MKTQNIQSLDLEPLILPKFLQSPVIDRRMKKTGHFMKEHDRWR